MQATTNQVYGRPSRRIVYRRPSKKTVYHRPYPNSVKSPAFWEPLVDKALFLAACFAVVVAFAFVLTL